MKIIKRIIGGLLVGTMFFTLVLHTDTKAENIVQASNKYEFRGVWMSTAYNIDWPQAKATAENQRADYINKVDRLAAAGFNALIFQVRPMGDAFYPSNFATWSQYITGTQGTNPGYDPLAFALEEAKKRNLEFHAWFNPFRISTDANFDVAAYISRLPAESPLKNNPQWIVKYAGSSRTNFWINPGIPEARQYVIDTILEVVRNYDIDGVHLDDYFYPYPVTTKDITGKDVRVDFPDNAEFTSFGAGFASKGDWRRDNVNKFIEQLYASIKNQKSSVKFGVSPFGIWKNSTAEGGAGTNGMSSFSDLFADSKLWIDKGWLDYIIPQVYWNFGFAAADYKLLTDWWSQKVSGRNVSLYIGHAAYKIGDASQSAAWSNAAEIPNQIIYNRKNTYIQGSAFFSTRDILANKLGIYDQMKDNLYKTKALIPTMPWRDAVVPEAPSVISAVPSGSNIEVKWNKSPAADVKKYVIYRFAEGETVNLQDSSKIAAIVNANAAAVNSYTDITAGAASRYIYVVTALDAYNNESIASSFGMTFGKALTFTADKASPQKINTAIQLKAEVLGGSNLLYRISIDDGTGWKVHQEYSSNTLFQWVPSLIGRYNIKLEVKDISSTKDYDIAVMMPYIVNGLYKVAIDPGHGGTDPGATGFSGSKEKDLNLIISRKIRDLLVARGIEVLMTREIDMTLSLPARASAANGWRVDAFVSIHQNSFTEAIKDPGGNVIGTRYPEGIETYSFPGSLQGAALAARIQDNMIKNTAAVNRGAKTANFFVIKETDMPSALVECGFITNPAEEARLLTEEYQNIIASSIADGILQYLNVNGEDVDKNGVVDMIDLELAALSYGSKPGDISWLAAADVNNDGIIDLLDITLIAKKQK